MENQEAYQRPDKIVDIMLAMTRINNFDKLLDGLLKGALKLVPSAKVSVMLLNHSTGELEVVRSSSKVKINKKIRLSSGIFGSALKYEKPIRVDDFSIYKGQKYYVKQVADTRSQISLPLVIDSVQVRVRCDVETGSKSLGVLNLESPHIKAFSEKDEERLWLLARHAAILLDKLHYEKKLNQIREIEQKIANEKNYEQILKIVVESITRILDFKFANISIIEGNYIKSKYISGMPTKTKEKEFKEMAIHSLDSDDIQSDIVRTQRIEVPEKNDPRFDQKIFKKFSHENLIRVFVPMIDMSSSNKVLGTVEGGYLRQYRKYIYEQDIQILKNSVNYAVQALERRRSELIDCITHEFRSPIGGIRSNASFLQRRFYQLSSDLIDQKFNDILTDCEILLYQVEELEHFLGDRRRQRFKIQRTFVFRDIIIKIINQLKPIVIDRGFSPSKIEYPHNCSKISVFTDKVKLNQVVYNLLINAIKYAEKDPDEFHISLEINDKPNVLKIKFKDWGIGIKYSNKDKIFEEGFRSTEAIERHVAGSGLGLTIARKLMRQLGGDLKLVNPYKPTEFEMILEKKTKEKLEHDLIR